MAPAPALRRTKIVATLGPATDTEEQLMRLVAAGVDAVRLNFSHGTAEDHERRAKAVRSLTTACGKEVAVIADLQGPKIRVARFTENAVSLIEGASFMLDVNHPKTSGTQEIVGIDYEGLPEDVVPGDFLLLDDGRIVLQVERVEAKCITTKVVSGGILSNNKGINRQGGGLSADALTPKDREDLKTAVRLGADYIAISFPRDVADIQEAKALIAEAGGACGVIAKIERTEAIEHLDALIKVSDAIMVARGDLGVEIGDAELPAVQKHIIQRCRALDKPVITATQMMESMIHNAIPTRAEVFDVANAVLDGTDCVMLSAETASGEHPDKVVEAVVRICCGAEKQKLARVSGHRVECSFSKIEEAIAMSAMYAANHFPVRGIVAFTESGLTPLLMSRIRTGIPIFGFTRNLLTQRKMALYRGVYAVNCAKDFDRAIHEDAFVFNLLQHLKVVEVGDHILVTQGDTSGQPGRTNTLRIIQVK